MNDAMRELYQETIMGHNKQPRNFHGMDDADGKATGHNPLCGDKLVVFVKFNGDTVSDVSFVGDGCAISKSSASMMTEAVKDRNRNDARILYDAFHKLVTREDGIDESLLGKLRVFAGVGEFPARVKCAALPWRTLLAAIDEQAPGGATAVSTE